MTDERKVEIWVGTIPPEINAVSQYPTQKFCLVSEGRLIETAIDKPECYRPGQPEVYCSNCAIPYNALEQIPKALMKIGFDKVEYKPGQIALEEGDIWNKNEKDFEFSMVGVMGGAIPIAVPLGYTPSFEGFQQRLPKKISDIWEQKVKEVFDELRNKSSELESLATALKSLR